MIENSSAVISAVLVVDDIWIIQVSLALCRFYMCKFTHVMNLLIPKIWYNADLRRRGGVRSSYAEVNKMEVALNRK
ncbi:hypothetical protein Y1Q_0001062 [Alligator mississippiensis]|uniref:Uncharacterized protein n=1 Tax=Alligator mississippiensis TaxID=8496 RepID=A0A151NED5_ALLMI|nr:hypothetical protein Y1Q_0001062 [Alligator mississippiensis]